MMELLGWCSIGLIVSLPVGFGLTLGALIALKVVFKELKR